MPKAARQDLIDLGFNTEMFGAPSDWDQNNGYLDQILAEAELAVTDRIGSATYTGATSGSVTESRIKRAEIAWGAAELWRRRATFADSNAQASLQSPEHLRQREYFNHAKQYMDQYEMLVGQILDTPNGSSALLGHVETGPWSAESDAKLN